MKNINKETEVNSMWVMLPFLAIAFLMAIFGLLGTIKPLLALAVAIIAFFLAIGILSFLKIPSIEKKVKIMSILVIVSFGAMIGSVIAGFGILAGMSLLSFFTTLIWRAMLVVDQETEMWREYHQASSK